MKKWFVASVTALVLLVLPISTVNVTADKLPKGEKGRKGQAGKSSVAFIVLWEKDGERRMTSTSRAQSLSWTAS